MIKTVGNMQQYIGIVDLSGKSTQICAIAQTLLLMVFRWVLYFLSVIHDYKEI